MRTLKIYKEYNFRDKDPVIDVLRTAQQDSGIKISQIAAATGVAAGTIYNMFSGPTRKPQFATVVRIARALDLDIQVVKKAGAQRFRVIKGGRL